MTCKIEGVSGASNQIAVAMYGDGGNRLRVLQRKYNCSLELNNQTERALNANIYDAQLRISRVRLR